MYGKDFMDYCKEKSIDITKLDADEIVRISSIVKALNEKLLDKRQK